MWASLFFHVVVLGALMHVAHSFDPNMKCVDANDKSVFSVLIKDDGSISSQEKIAVTYQDPDNSEADCPANEVRVEYFKETELTDDATKHSVAVSAGTEADHEYTRIHVNINPCAKQETEEVAATTEVAAHKINKYTATLSMGSATWLAANIFILKCSFKQSTSSEQLAIKSSLVEALEDTTPVVNADLTIRTKNDDGTYTDLAASAGVVAVKLGQTIYLQAKIEGNLNVETGFKYCQICKTDACLKGETLDLIAEYSDPASKVASKQQMNCVHQDIRDNQRFILTVPSDSLQYAEFQFPAFRYTESTGESLFLKCQLAICNRGAESPCRKKCSPSGRKRRSAESQIEPLEATATVALKVVTPSVAHCSSTKTVRGTSRLTCTNGTKVGSICRQDCASGFASNLEGQKTGMRVCQEKVTDRIGPIYFGMRPAWTPKTPGCEDVNECLKNPCPTGSMCQNTVGSYYCQWLN